MNAAVMLDAIRLLQGLTQLVVNYNQHASPEQIKALVDEAHARGETIDLKAVAANTDTVNASFAELDEKIAAAQAQGR